jgi:hypothetical protein
MAASAFLLSGPAIAGLPLNAQTPSSAPSPASIIQVPPVVSHPIAIVPLDSRITGSAAVVTGALQVMNGKAVITSSGTVTSGTSTTEVDLPQRGSLNVCASTTVKLAADANVSSDEASGVLMAMDHGAVEANFLAGRNADIVLTPDFRILISGPGTAHLKVRLAQGGDTCVDNPGSDAPYVLVTSVFDGSDYRVQPGQRVMFQHGSLHEVVDQEKEPCGCPPAQPVGNDFPLAQSEGLAPLGTTKAASAQSTRTTASAQPLVYNAGNANSPAAGPSSRSESAAGAGSPVPSQPAPRRKTGFFARIGHFFGRIFGAE